MVVFAVFLSLSISEKCSAVTLVRDGEALYTIVIADDAIPAEVTAAKELQKYLGEVTGVNLPIQDEAESDEKLPHILVGAGKRARKLLPNEDWEGLGKDGIVIKSSGDALILAGGRPRGTLYAVFQFLEDEVGCRWWTPTEHLIPKKRTLEVKGQDIRYVPPFSYREHFATSTRESAFFATVLKENGKHQSQDEQWGGHYDILGFVHTFNKLLPTEIYFKDHPEWYPDPKNGGIPCTKDSSMPGVLNTQLCLTNPEVLDELSKNALKWIAANPSAGYISISQNDCSNYCACPRCSSLAREEEAQSANVLKFVNAVAERIHERYPDFLVETLAYSYTEKPPKTIRPGKNVLVRLAAIGTDFGHPINSEWNQKEHDKLLKWGDIAPNLFVWTYATNFPRTLFIHPNWAGLADDLRLYAANNVRGVFVQGDCYTGDVGDFPQLRAWVVGKLLWNPQQVQGQLMDEFLTGYYGAAAPWLRQYLDLTVDAFLKQKRGLNTSNADFSFLTLNVANEAVRLFEKAANAVKEDKVLSDRVRRERLSLEVTMINRDRFLREEAKKEGVDYLGGADLQQSVDAFTQTAKEFGVRLWGEGITFNVGVAEMMKVLTAPEVPLPDFLKDYSRSDVIDFQPDLMHLYRNNGLVAIEADQGASGGTAVTLKGSTTSWDIQAHLGSYLGVPNEEWRIYIIARVDAAPEAVLSEAAFQGGVFDISSMTRSASFSIPLNKVGGSQYHTIDLGTHMLSGGMYVWFGPLNKPSIKMIHVDRIILLRAKAIKRPTE